MIRTIDSDTEIESLCEHLNDIIEQAIIHGGDNDGPYCINEEELIKHIKIFLGWIGLDKYVIIYNSSIPKLLIKEKILQGSDKE